MNSGSGKGYGRRRSRNNRGGQNQRDTGSRQRHNQTQPQASQSPPSEPRVVLLRPSASNSSSATATVSAIATSSRSESPKAVPRNNPSPGVSTHRATASPNHNLYQVKPYVPEDESKKELKVPKQPMKLIDFESWNLLDHPSIEYMSNDTQSSTGFKVISVLGSQSSGKSRLLNLIAGKDCFKTHESFSNNGRGSLDDNGPCDLLDSVTKGVDFMITPERLFLLDSQALLSPSILDELIVNSNISINSNDHVSNEADLLYVSSLQLVTFLMAVSDCLIITSDYIVDIDLLKLFSMALKLLSSISPATSAANIVWYLNQKARQSEVDSIAATFELYFGKGNIVVINGDEDELVKTAMLTSTDRRRGPNADHQTSNSVVSERMWFVSGQRLWESSIKKSNIFNDYLRFGSIDG